MSDIVATEAPKPAPPESPLRKTPAPKPKTVEEVQHRQIVIANRTRDVEKRARELAENHLQNQLRSRKIFRRIRFRLAEEYYRQKFTQEAMKAMLENNNSYLSMTFGKEAAVDAGHGAELEKRAGSAKIEQVKLESTIEGEEIREATGELKKAIIEEILKPIVRGEVKDQGQVQTKLREFVEAHKDDADVQAIFGTDMSKYGTLAQYFSTDLLEMGQLVKGDRSAHGSALDKLDGHVSIKLANVRWGAETEVSETRTDRFIKWCQKRRLTGAIFNPAVIGAASSIATFVGLRAPGRAMSVAAHMAAPGVGMFSGGLFAALRRSRDLKIDRASYQVEMAYGMQIPEDARRRERIQEHAYDVVSVRDLLQGRGEYTDARGTRQRRNIQELVSVVREGGADSDLQNDLISQIAEIQERLDFSAREKIDLITFEGREQVEQGRLSLVKAIAEARQSLNITDSDFELRKVALREQFNQSVEEKDKAFKLYRIKSSLASGVFGGAAGLGAGVLVSQGLEFGLNKFGSGGGGVRGAPTSISEISHERSVGAGAVAEQNIKVPQAPEFITGTEASNRFKELATPINRQEWYGYDMPKSQGNELRLFTHKQGDTLTLDMSKMQLGYQSGLNPNPIDVQQVIANHESGFAFSLPEMQGMKVWVPDGVDGQWDGLLHLDPHSSAEIVFPNSQKTTLGEFSQMVVNQQKLSILPDGDIATEVYGREDVFNLGSSNRMGYIEAGRLIQQDGQNTLQTFATIRGSSAPQIPVITEVETAIPTPREVPPVGEKGPSVIPVERVPGDHIDVPIIPIPFAPRYPLEPLATQKLLYELHYYNAPHNEELEKRLKDQRSKTLKENPKAILDPRTEITSYFEKQDESYVKEIEELVDQIKTPPPANLRAVVGIPVAGHQEANNIYSTLKNYTFQDAPKDQFEVVLFVNYPEKGLDGSPLNADKTLAEIARFKKDHPDFPVHVMTKVLPIGKTDMGRIRKYLNDAVLFRHLRKGETAGELIIISNDADSKGVVPTYISNFISKFDANPEVEGMLGQLDWDPEGYINNPLVHVGTRLFQYLNTIGRRRTGRMTSSGANFAFKGSTYAATGGYLTDMDGAEDVWFGKGIIAARGGDHQVIQFGGERSRLYTSARRALEAIEKGYAPLEQWEKGFGAFDEARNIDVGEGEKVNYDDPVQLAKLKTGFEWVINRTLDQYEGGEKLGKDAVYYRKALGYLGVKYELKDSNVKITDMSSLIKGLKRYQNIGVLLRDIKSGKGTVESRAELKRLLDEEDRKLPEESIRDEIEEKTLSLKELKNERFTLEELQASEHAMEIGRYMICSDKILGTGEMGDVVAGYDKETGKLVAVKRVKKDELERIAHVNNYPQGVVDLEDYIKDKITESEVLSIYKEKIENGDEIVKIYPQVATDLSTYLKGSRRLNPEDALNVAIRTAQALRELHSVGIIHTDVFSFNILLGENGEVRLGDLGIGSLKDASGKATRGFVTGFRWGKPQELFEENPNLTESTDTYELSALLYRTLTGDYPYSSGAGTEVEKTQKLYEAHKKGEFTIPDDVPEAIQKILKKGIQPDQAKRYQTAEEMLTDLKEAQASLTTRIEKQEPVTTEAPAVMETGSLNLEVAEKSIASSEHLDRNEDSVISDKTSSFVGVFDGLGGHAAGDVASSLAAREIKSHLLDILNSAESQTGTSQQIIERALYTAWVNSKNAFTEYIYEHPEAFNMDTTATIVQLFKVGDQKHAGILHVGDSRAYVVKKDGTIEQITKDDSLVDRELKGGNITEKQAREISEMLDELTAMPQDQALETYFLRRNEITNTLFTTDEPDIVTHPLTENDAFIFVTSDGIHDNLTRSQIAAIAKGAKSADELTQRLVEEAQKIAGKPQSENVRAKPDDMSVATIKL